MELIWLAVESSLLPRTRYDYNFDCIQLIGYPKK